MFKFVLHLSILEWICLKLRLIIPRGYLIAIVQLQVMNIICNICRLTG